MYADAIKRALAPELARKKSQELQEAAARKTDAMRQHEYMVARQSILGDFSALPISASQECITNAKAARRRERLQLVSSEIVACPRHAAQAARLRKDMDEVENMRCAKHVYLANDPEAPRELRDNPPPGFLKPTAEQLEAMGLSENMLTPEGSQFRAAVYIKDPAVWGAFSKPPAVLAFRGSTASAEDWENNFNQDANQEAPYYRQAVKIGNRLSANAADMQIVGHSLGGGLASAAQGGSGLIASTYNAAGLHPATVARYSQDANHVAAEAGKITAIRIKGEVLTTTQEDLIGSQGLSLLANDAVGVKKYILPSHNKSYFHQLQHEKKVDPNDDYATYLHGMDEIINSTEKNKASDEAAINSCRGKRRAQ
ncbi:DUF2974 domain-containing protein [Geomonas nitrogeniifigens]|uniref:DUF2974 domain-containing protein n=1 Tax=Geomonas diazotrophica TaxID=2843197 RepID=A0ABX8JPQ5_9BACT|nr:Mbeg1-like protein [Geomonas nitrogeniifigens]QWV98604.1 DUF2974 domain-containing protein [Geomonas nitrogeniifigens]QXE87780.1 DUF2974 domain-containing protein [Geomonas nitrogeniifigens]